MIFDYIVNIFSSVANPLAVYFILTGILLLCGFGLPLPEDVILISGGYLAYSGYIDIRIFLPVAFAGVLVGDCCIFLIGRKTGYSLLRHRVVSRLIKPEHIQKATAIIDKYHDKIFFFARFLPGLRATIFFSGGALKTKFWKFFLFDSLAALISIPLIVLGAYYGGEYIDQILKVAKGIQLVLLLVSIMIIVFIVFKVRRWMAKKASMKNHLNNDLKYNREPE